MPTCRPTAGEASIGTPCGESIDSMGRSYSSFFSLDTTNQSGPWRTLRRHQVPLVLGLVTLVHLVAAVWWLGLDTLDVYWVPDDFAHVAGLFQLSTSLELGGPGAALRYLVEINSHYPFLAHYPPALAAQLLGSAALSARAANVVYFVLLLVCVHGIGKRCHGRQAGLLAAVLVSLTPAVYGGWRTIGLDFPSLCATPLAILCLLRCHGFRRVGPSVAVGLAAGLATLLKAQSLFFILGPALLVLGGAARRAWPQGALARRQLATGVLAALLSFLALTSIWWAGRLGYFWEQLASHATGQGMHHFEGDVSLWGGVKYYFATLPYLAPALLVVVSLALLPLFFKYARHRHVILIWIVLPLLIHVVFKLRHYRYLFPLVPAVALLAAIGLVSLRPRWRGVAVATLATALLFWFVFCPFSGVLCSHVQAHQLSRYYEAVQRDNKLAAYFAGCGDGMFIAPKCLPYVNAGDARLGRRMARWIRTRQPAGADAILYHGVVETNFALAVRRGLPSLRLSEYVFGDYKHYQPPASWHRYSMFEYRGTPPEFTRKLRRDQFLLLQKPVEPGHRSDELFLVLWKLPPGESWPRSTRDGLARYIEGRE